MSEYFTSTTDTINSKILDILNPTLHHHDLLQSYVRAPTVEDVTNLKEYEELESLNKHCTSLGICFAPGSSEDVSKGNQVSNKKTKQKNDKNQQKSNTDNSSVGSEVKIQKKKKWCRRGNDAYRHEEVYTDKDRAAAVNMGTKDIKQSLKIKQKQDKNFQHPENTEPSAILALGLREMRLGDIKIAMNCINKALELDPNDSNALIARSKCHLLLGEPLSALQDADDALQHKMKNANMAKATHYKAEALYNLGDFEMSLVYYYRGMKIRPEYGQFRLGVQKAKDAILNILRKS